MMAALRHPNVVSFLGVCVSPPCVATEYCSRGSLTDVLRGAARSPQKAAQLDWARRLNMVSLNMVSSPLV
jgi:serine/threonine protein kinase